MISRICGLFLKKLGWHNLNTHISHTTHHLHFHLFWCQCHILWFHRDNVITALWLLNWHLHWRAQNTHTSCTYPQCLPITSRMKVLWWLHNNRFWVRSSEISCLLCSHLKMECLWAYLCAVVVMASTISMMRCRAESVPMVMSVPQKSLSMEPTMPTILRWEADLASIAVILPEDQNDKTLDK